MKISRKDWLAYIDKLSRLDRMAADRMKAYVGLHGLEDADALIDYAYGIATKYGEGSAALAAEMYDTIASLSGKYLPPAEPAPTPDHDEVAKTVNGTKKNTDVMADAIGRLVKRTGVDTTMKNAIRDAAYWAWIPSGDTCAFCITLASRGWQKASKKALKNGHAEHIHAHCDCTYAVSFDGDKTTYGDYDPDQYLEMYENAEGDTPEDKINALRRENYQQNKDKINAQKRAACAAKVERLKATDVNSIINHMDVTNEYASNATPNVGQYIIENGFKDNNGEEYIGQWLHDTFGGDITLLAANNPKGEKNPDYFWRGRYWDLKTVTTEKAANSAVRSGLKQIKKLPGGVVLDYRDIPIDDRKLEKVLNERMKWSRIGKVDIIIKRGSGYKVFRYLK